MNDDAESLCATNQMNDNAESLCATNKMNYNECHDQATRTDEVVNSSEDLASEDLGG